ncbi:MAG: acyltransferase [Pseudomonadota bacterium]
MSQPYFAALDSWRGICALLVCLFHFPAVGVVTEWAFFKNGFLFVDFFFVLSGFVIAANYEGKIKNRDNVFQFLWLRVGRLYPLHLVVFAAYLAFELVKLFFGDAHSAFTGDKPVEAIPTNLLLLQAMGFHDDVTWNRPSWSISAEMYTYLIFALTLIFAGRFRLAAYAGILTGAYVIIGVYNDGNLFVLHDYALFRCLAGFFAGTITWGIWRSQSIDRENSKSVSNWMIWTLMEIISILAVVVFTIHVRDISWSYLAPFIFSLAVFVFAFEKGRVSSILKRRFLVYLGALSYSTYMIHQFVIDRGLNVAAIAERVSDVAFLRYNAAGYVELDTAPFTSDILAIGYLAIVICVAGLTYRWIEVPCRDAFRAALKKRQALNTRP